MSCLSATGRSCSHQWSTFFDLQLLCGWSFSVSDRVLRHGISSSRSDLFLQYQIQDGCHHGTKLLFLHLELFNLGVVFLLVCSLDLSTNKVELHLDGNQLCFFPDLYVAICAWFLQTNFRATVCSPGIMGMLFTVVLCFFSRKGSSTI